MIISLFRVPILLLIVFLASCGGGSLHEEVLSNTDINSKYALYEKNSDIESNKPIKSGVLGKEFFACFNNAKNIYALGGTDKNYYFEVYGENGIKYYYDLNTTDNRIVRLSRWKEKTKYGYEGSGSNYSLECSLDDLT